MDTARLRLCLAGPHLLADQYKCTGNVARSLPVIDLIFVIIANFAIQLWHDISSTGTFFKPRLRICYFLLSFCYGAACNLPLLYRIINPEIAL
ncbi:hypothetical protein FHY04_002623 [Sphingomonas sp. BK481]|jgi:hypothetical protein|nr:hypothetical protein [Sphingomonas sp. BK481]